MHQQEHRSGTTTQERLEPVVGQAKEQAQQIGQEARAKAGDAIGNVRDQIDGQMARGKEQAAASLRDFSSELEQMAPHATGMASDLAAQAARRSRGLADWLEQRKPQDLVRALEDSARRRPIRFLFWSAAAGVVLGRMTRGMVDTSAGATGEEPTSAPPAGAPISPGVTGRPPAAAEPVPPRSFPPEAVQVTPSRYVAGAPVASTTTIPETGVLEGR